jgi:hypothetical protein
VVALIQNLSTLCKSFLQHLRQVSVLDRTSLYQFVEQLKLLISATLTAEASPVEHDDNSGAETDSQDEPPAATTEQPQ